MADTHQEREVSDDRLRLLHRYYDTDYPYSYMQSSARNRRHRDTAAALRELQRLRATVEKAMGINGGLHRIGAPEPEVREPGRTRVRCPHGKSYLDVCMACMTEHYEDDWRDDDESAHPAAEGGGEGLTEREVRFVEGLRRKCERHEEGNVLTVPFHWHEVSKLLTLLDHCLAPRPVPAAPGEQWSDYWLAWCDDVGLIRNALRVYAIRAKPDTPDKVCAQEGLAALDRIVSRVLAAPTAPSETPQGETPDKTPAFVGAIWDARPAERSVTSALPASAPVLTQEHADAVLQASRFLESDHLTGVNSVRFCREVARWISERASPEWVARYRDLLTEYRIAFRNHYDVPTRANQREYVDAARALDAHVLGREERSDER